jgi:hypothetical protein
VGQVPRLTEAGIACFLVSRTGPFSFRRHLVVPNVSWGFLAYEADLLIVPPSRYIVEAEIKVSKSDLIRDKVKRRSHSDPRLHRLWFVGPASLGPALLEHAPPRAGVGIVHCDRKWWIWEVLRPAPDLKPSRRLTDDEMFKLARLGTIRFWTRETGEDVPEPDAVDGAQLPLVFNCDCGGRGWVCEYDGDGVPCGQAPCPFCG